MIYLQLVEVFGQTRDDWMKEDMEDWLNRNPIYEILPDILQYAIENDEAYIVTTKQVRFLHISPILITMLAFPFQKNSSSCMLFVSSFDGENLCHYSWGAFYDGQVMKGFRGYLIT